MGHKIAKPSAFGVYPVVLLKKKVYRWRLFRNVDYFEDVKEIHTVSYKKMEDVQKYNVMVKISNFSGYRVFRDVSLVYYFCLR